MLSVIGKIQGEDYQKVASFALDRSDAIMLIFRTYGRPYKKSIREARERLKPFRVASRNNHKTDKEGFEWPGTISWDPTLIHADIYRLSPEVREYVLSAEEIFAWIYPERPEDIAFFFHGECWLSTTAHEEFCDITGYEDEMASLLDSLGIEYDRCEDAGKPYIEKYTL